MVSQGASKLASHHAGAQGKPWAGQGGGVAHGPWCPWAELPPGLLYTRWIISLGLWVSEESGVWGLAARTGW